LPFRASPLAKRKRKPWRGLESFFPFNDYHTLDATAGLRQYWKGKDQRGVVFLDVRREVKPDIVASNEYLPFRSGIFKRVFYDPPHVVNPFSSTAKSTLGWRYGFWEHKSELVRNAYLVNKEFARVLQPRGKLTFFYTDLRDNPSLESMLALFNNFRILRRKRSKSGAHTNNYRYVVELEKLS